MTLNSFYGSLVFYLSYTGNRGAASYAGRESKVPHVNISSAVWSLLYTAVILLANKLTSLGGMLCPDKDGDIDGIRIVSQHHLHDVHAMQRVQSEGYTCQGGHSDPLLQVGYIAAASDASV